jgi:hypothetical protein
VSELPLLSESLLAVTIALARSPAPAGGDGSGARGGKRQQRQQAQAPAAHRIQQLLLVTQRLMQAVPLEPTASAASAREARALSELQQLPYVSAQVARALCSPTPCRASDVSSTQPQRDEVALETAARADGVGSGAPTSSAATTARSASAKASAKGSAKKRSKAAKGAARAAAGEIAAMGGVSAGADTSRARAAEGDDGDGHGLCSMCAVCRAEPLALSESLQSLGLTAAEAADACAVAAAFPSVSLSVSCEVADEERVQCGDLVTVTVHVLGVRRARSEGGGASGGCVAHAPWVPAAVSEAFSIMLIGADGQLLAFQAASLKAERQNADARAPLDASVGGAEVKVPPGGCLDCAQVRWVLKVSAD